jgi:hypothetical protein
VRMMGCGDRLRGGVRVVGGDWWVEMVGGDGGWRLVGGDWWVEIGWSDV